MGERKQVVVEPLDACGIEPLTESGPNYADVRFEYDEGANQLRMVDTGNCEVLCDGPCDPHYLTDSLYAENKRQELLAMLEFNAL